MNPLVKQMADIIAIRRSEAYEITPQVLYMDVEMAEQIFKDVILPNFYDPEPPEIPMELEGDTFKEVEQ